MNGWFNGRDRGSSDWDRWDKYMIAYVDGYINAYNGNSE